MERIEKRLLYEKVLCFILSICLLSLCACSKDSKQQTESQCDWERDFTISYHYTPADIEVKDARDLYNAVVNNLSVSGHNEYTITNTSQKTVSIDDIILEVVVKSGESFQINCRESDIVYVSLYIYLVKPQEKFNLTFSDIMIESMLHDQGFDYDVQWGAKIKEIIYQIK